MASTFTISKFGSLFSRLFPTSIPPLHSLVHVKVAFLAQLPRELGVPWRWRARVIVRASVGIWVSHASKTIKARKNVHGLQKNKMVEEALRVFVKIFLCSEWPHAYKLICGYHQLGQHLYIPWSFSVYMLWVLF